MSISAPDIVDVAVCVVGAGPVGATLACLLGSAGIPVAVVDRAALPPMEHPDFDGRAYAIASGSRRLLEQAGVWRHLPLPSGPIEDIRVSDGRLGRPASPLFLHFDHREIGEPFGWMTEARSLRVALNAALHESPAILVAAPAQATVLRRDAGGRGGPDERRPHRARPAAGGRRGSRQPAAPGGRHRGDAAALQPDRPGVRGGARPSPPQPGAGALPARRPVRAAADGRHRGRASPVGDRVDRAGRAGGPAARAAGGRVRARDPATAGPPPRRRATGRPALELQAECPARAQLRVRPPRAGRGRGARRAPDRRPGAQPRLPRRPGAGRAADRGARAGRGPRRRGAAARLPGGAAAGQPRNAGGDGRARPAVLQRQPGAAAGARPRHRRGEPDPAAATRLHARGDGRADGAARRGARTCSSRTCGSRTRTPDSQKPRAHPICHRQEAEAGPFDDGRHDRSRPHGSERGDAASPGRSRASPWAPWTSRRCGNRWWGKRRAAATRSWAG